MIHDTSIRPEVPANLAFASSNLSYRCQAIPQAGIPLMPLYLLCDAHCFYTAINVYAMLFRPTLVLGLDAVKYIESRLGHPADIHDREVAIFKALDHVVALAASNPAITAADPALIEASQTLIELAAGHPEHIISTITDGVKGGKGVDDLLAELGYDASDVSYLRNASL